MQGNATFDRHTSFVMALRRWADSIAMLGDGDEKNEHFDCFESRCSNFDRLPTEYKRFVIKEAEDRLT